MSNIGLSIFPFSSVLVSRRALSESSYREAMENSSTYNNRLVGERRQRMPFLDAQTGVAQSDCFLWMQKWERMPGKYEGQLYSYPSRKWRKKRRQYLMTDSYLQRAKRDIDSNENESIANASENNVKMETNDSNDKYYDSSKEAWYQEFDDGSDLPDAGELDDPESDYDDYEEYSSKKKKKRKDTPKRKRVEYTDAEKPYSCDLCGARYKTRPGLSYHYSHSHQNEPERGPRAPVPNLEEEDMPYTPPRQLHPPPTQVPPPQGPPMQSVPPPTPTVPMPPIQSAQHASPVQQHSSPSSSAMSAAARASTAVDDTVEVPRSASGKPLASPSPYCDFCLGDSVENKKTKSAEELVSCSDCGRSAHPTCLQFTANMIISVKKYRWQCIECKSCGLCGTSDNDDQLLFCDDCDRGYHMYCLQPPLSEPPEGSWSCHLCIEEYHTPKR